MRGIIERALRGIDIEAIAGDIMSKLVISELEIWLDKSGETMYYS